MLRVPKAPESKDEVPAEVPGEVPLAVCVLMGRKETSSSAHCGAQGAFVYKCRSGVQEGARVFILTFSLLPFPLSFC